MQINEISGEGDSGLRWQRLCEQLDPQDAEWLHRIYELSHRVYHGRFRRTPKSGALVPQIVHAVRVASILSVEWKITDRRTIAAALCHDTLRRDARRVEQEIEAIAGKEIVEAVYTLTEPRLPEAVPEDARAARDARYFSVVRQAPEWVRIVKCADRLDDLREAADRGDAVLWRRISSHTIGWHLLLAKETLPMAQVALFHAIVRGERRIFGRTPLWVDGHIVDPEAAALIPESLARSRRLVGIALRGSTLVIGSDRPADSAAMEAVERATSRSIVLLPITTDSMQDALAAGTFAPASLPGTPVVR